MGGLLFSLTQLTYIAFSTSHFYNTLKIKYLKLNDIAISCRKMRGDIFYCKHSFEFFFTQSYLKERVQNIVKGNERKCIFIC